MYATRELNSYAKWREQNAHVAAEMCGKGFDFSELSNCESKLSTQRCQNTACDVLMSSYTPQSMREWNDLLHQNLPKYTRAFNDKTPKCTERAFHQIVCNSIVV